MLAGALAVFVIEKFAEVAPVALATTLYGPPAVAFAVNVAGSAKPPPFLRSPFDVAFPLPHVTLAPLPATVKVPPLFFFNDTATTETYTLSLHDALPIS